MAENTKIEWTDHTWNPWIGCTEVGPACDHCYARTLMAGRFGMVLWGLGNDRLKTSTANWRDPYKWNRVAMEDGTIATVFCLSLGDIWDNEVDPLWRRQAFKVMRETQNLLYLLLSKRIGNAEKMCDLLAGCEPLPRNAALGATMATQEEWDRDLPKLKQAAKNLGARFSFASVEPMLGPIDAHGKLPDWVIVGGESGQNARPMHPDWARSLRDQCKAAGVKFFFKQWGEWRPSGGWVDGRIDPASHGVSLKGNVAPAPDLMIGKTSGPEWDGYMMIRRVGKKSAGRLLDGREWNEMPDVRHDPL